MRGGVRGAECAVALGAPLAPRASPLAPRTSIPAQLLVTYLPEME